MKAEIINIGDEILIGQITNTNSVWLAQQLNTLGIAVTRMTTVADEKNAIITALGRALEENTILILTGGLGPTKDDITKKVLAEFFGVEMDFRQEVFDHLDAWFKKRGRTFSEANQAQCWVPSNARLLMNNWGTAPGMLFEHQDKIMASFPGVPAEMKSLFSHYMEPLLKEKFNLPPVYHRSYNIEGIPESELMKTIEAWEDALPPSIKLAYLPSMGLVRLRMSSLNADGKAPQLMDAEEQKLTSIIGDDIFSHENQTLEQVIKDLLVKTGTTLCTAESCTGGYLAHKLTTVPGISKVYPGSLIAYDYWVKSEILGVKEQTLQTFGAVSKEVVTEMALAAREKFKTDYAIALSGIAGPDGGTPEKPVGTVWIAWATPKEVIAKRFQFAGDRQVNVHVSYQKALSILRKIMLNIPLKKEFWEK